MHLKWQNFSISLHCSIVTVASKSACQCAGVRENGPGVHVFTEYISKINLSAYPSQNKFVFMVLISIMNINNTHVATITYMYMHIASLIINFYIPWRYHGHLQ